MLLGDDIPTEEMQNSYDYGVEYSENAPEWAKQIFATVLSDPEMNQRALDIKNKFDGIVAAKASKENGQETEAVLGKPEELKPEDFPELLDNLKQGVRYVRKHNRFTSGVRRFGIDVMTNDTYPNFKFIRFKNEAERDDEFLNLLTVESTKEYPEPEKE
ncbi:hypothetical protein SDC9_75571 [bioreactor metagenome]|uniref:Uncharacterized protein n=1 Tax=bioreactor metagenome TaxID=1076179 RepID=A0A644YK61_9ZZZZ